MASPRRRSYTMDENRPDSVKLRVPNRLATPSLFSVSTAYKNDIAPKNQQYSPVIPAVPSIPQHYQRPSPSPPARTHSPFNNNNNNKDIFFDADAGFNTLKDFHQQQRIQNESPLEPSDSASIRKKPPRNRDTMYDTLKQESISSSSSKSSQRQRQQRQPIPFTYSIPPPSSPITPVPSDISVPAPPPLYLKTRNSTIQSMIPQILSPATTATRTSSILPPNRLPTPPGPRPDMYRPNTILRDLERDMPEYSLNSPAVDEDEDTDDEATVLEYSPSNQGSVKSANAFSPKSPKSNRKPSKDRIRDPDTPATSPHVAAALQILDQSLSKYFPSPTLSANRSPFPGNSGSNNNGSREQRRSQQSTINGEFAPVPSRSISKTQTILSPIKNTNRDTTMTFGESQIQFPDGGYGWVIVFASFLIHFMCIGMQLSWGIFQEYYRGTNITPVLPFALIGSVAAALTPGFGPVVWKIGDWLGIKMTVFVGMIIMVAGLITASFVDSYWALFATQGVCVGIGSSFCFFPAINILPQYFSKKRRGIAMGIVSAGSGVGGIAWVELTHFLLNKYDRQWTLRISGFFITGVLLLAITLLKPRSISRQSSISKPSLNPYNNWLPILKDAKFFLMFFIAILAAIGSFVPLHYIPTFAKSLSTDNTKTGAILLSTYTGASALGTIVTGILADMVLGPLNTSLVCFLTSGTFIMTLWYLSTSFPLMLTYTILGGFTTGGVMALLPVITASLFGMKNISKLNGVIYMGVALGILLGSPIAGNLVGLVPVVGVETKVETFFPALYYAAGALFGGGVLVAVVKVLMKKGFWSRV